MEGEDATCRLGWSGGGFFVCLFRVFSVRFGFFFFSHSPPPPYRVFSLQCLARENLFAINLYSL